jgi:hypothetical protein
MSLSDEMKEQISAYLQAESELQTQKLSAMEAMMSKMLSAVQFR